MPDLSGYLERTGKYTSSWKKRFVTFNSHSRQLAYGQTKEKGTKSMIILTKLVRCAEFDEKLHRSHPDLFTLVCDGTMEDGKNDSWKLRFPDESTFNLWYDNMRNVLAHAGLMTSKHFGLPAEDPRNNIPFVEVPLENMMKFALLEKAIMYFFGRIQLHLPAGIGPTGHKTMSAIGDLYFMIGDKFCYVFRPSADVVRCFDPNSIVSIYICEQCIGIKLDPPEHDILIKNTFGRTIELLEILSRIHKSITGGNDLEIEPWQGTIDELAEKMKLDCHAGFKISVASPTPKVKLRQALDKFLKQNGVTFSAETAHKIHSEQSGSSERQSRPRSISMPKGIDMEDPMVVMLCKLHLQQYAAKLLKQHIDIDMLTCMEPNDLVNFGINNPSHRETIIDAANGKFPEPGAKPEAQAPPAAGNDGGDTTEAQSPSKAAVTLDSDSDDDLGVQVPASPNAQKPPPVLLDDSDDDSDDDLQVVIPQQLQQKAMSIMLSSDDEEDDALPGFAKAVTLDDDDI